MGDALVELLEWRLKRAVLWHLSRDCNRPDLAVSSVRKRLDEAGGTAVEVVYAGPVEVTPRFAVAGA